MPIGKIINVYDFPDAVCFIYTTLHYLFSDMNTFTTTTSTTTTTPIINISNATTTNTTSKTLSLPSKLSQNNLQGSEIRIVQKLLTKKIIIIVVDKNKFVQ